MLRNNSFIVALVIVFIFTMCCTFAYADEMNSNKVISGDYQFSSIVGEVQIQNTFVYRDDCFTRSSFLGCKHLESLSIQVAASSISFYSQEPDYYEIATDVNANNIIDFLTKMEFEDVETNTYYKTEKHENSAGVCVGHKNIIQSGDSYTLLAVVPRSAGYKQEWAGNFIIGDGDIHEGFKAARDEILRFVKKYINENGISGKIKVWISGYSRGAAISDMLGGFFAGGGIEYFDDVVSITPEDVYCYTIGTPRTIKDGLDKNIELSVSANRVEPEYKDDTEGEEFIYTKGGKVTVGDAIYSGLRNVIFSNDSFPLLPPEEWGFTHYGNLVDPADGLSSVEDALKELKDISTYAYDTYTQDDKVKEFRLKTFDLKTLSIVDKGEPINPAEFMKEKVDGLAQRVGSNQDFCDNHYQDGLKSFMGAYGLLATVLDDAISDSGIGTSDAIKVALYTYFDYASELLQEEGLADDDEEALLIIIKDLLDYFFEIDVDYEEFTIDDLLASVMKYIADNLEEPVGTTVISAIVNYVPENYHDLIRTSLGKFDRDYYIDEETEEINPDLTVEDALEAYIKACAYGVDPECVAYEDYKEPKQAREIAFFLVSWAVEKDYPQLVQFLYVDNSAENGHGLLKDAIELLFNELLVEKNKSGDIIKEYDSISDLADESLLNLLEPILEKSVELCDDIYGKEYSEALEDEINELKNYITEARKAISILMFYKSGEYDTVPSLESAISIVSNAMTIVMGHFDEVYLAFSRMSDRYEDHSSPTDVYHDVKFELNKGKFIKETENPQKVLDGNLVDNPGKPIRGGYRFIGWYIDEELNTLFDFDTPITEDIVLYAKWNAHSSGGGSSESKKDNTIWNNASEWAVEELKKAEQNNLIPQTFANKDFTQSISRSDFAAVAVKLYEAISGKTAVKAENNPFIDTNDEYVLKAYALNITSGISETEFGNGTITREQMATMITRALSKAGIDVSIELDKVEKFSDDNQMNDWGRTSIYFMSNQGIIKGVGNNLFNPLGNAKIEEAISISLRCLELYNLQK